MPLGPRRRLPTATLDVVKSSEQVDDAVPVEVLVVPLVAVGQQAVVAGLRAVFDRHARRVAEVRHRCRGRSAGSPALFGRLDGVGHLRWPGGAARRRRPRRLRRTAAATRRGRRCCWAAASTASSLLSSWNRPRCPFERIHGGHPLLGGDRWVEVQQQRVAVVLDVGHDSLDTRGASPVHVLGQVGLLPSGRRRCPAGSPRTSLFLRRRRPTFIRRISAVSP